MTGLSYQAVPWLAHLRDRDWTCPPPAADVWPFHRELEGYVPTPLTDLPTLAAQLGVGRVLAKDESQRLGLGAFKGLGASWAVHQAVSRHGGERELTVVAATDGNHGRAVARFARLLGHQARIFIPRGVHPTAAQNIRDEGADLINVDGNYDDAVEAARQAASTSDSVLVQDTAWEGYEEIPAAIVDGYATMFLEIDQQLRASDSRQPGLVLVPTGVGSLLQAVLTHYRQSVASPRTAVVSVEPDSAACMQASLAAGAAVTIETGSTIMSGLNCGTPSPTAWPYVRNGLDAAVTVTDSEATTAAHTLAAQGVDAGPCGAATLAALQSILDGPSAEHRMRHLDLDQDSTVVLLVTEGSSSNPLPTPHPGQGAG